MGGEAGGRPAHHRDVHTVRAGPETAAQAGGSKGQAGGESIAQRGLVARRQQRRELVAVAGLRIVLDPRTHAAGELGVHGAIMPG